MRFTLSFRMPTEKANALIKEGTFPQTMQSIMEDIKPEAAYFTDMDGARGGILIINMDDDSELPGMVEPLMHALGATVKLQFVVTPEGLQKGTPALEQAAQKYGLRERAPASVAAARGKVVVGILPFFRNSGPSFLPYSPKCLEKLSEKGYERRSERGFGRYTEGKISQIGPFRRSVELRCRHLRDFSDSF